MPCERVAHCQLQVAALPRLRAGQHHRRLIRGSTASDRLGTGRGSSLAALSTRARRFSTFYTASSRGRLIVHFPCGRLDYTVCKVYSMGTGYVREGDRGAHFICTASCSRVAPRPITHQPCGPHAASPISRRRRRSKYQNRAPARAAAQRAGRGAGLNFSRSLDFRRVVACSRAMRDANLQSHQSTSTHEHAHLRLPHPCQRDSRHPTPTRCTRYRMPFPSRSRRRRLG